MPSPSGRYTGWPGRLCPPGSPPGAARPCPPGQPGRGRPPRMGGCMSPPGTPPTALPAPPPWHSATGASAATLSAPASPDPARGRWPTCRPLASTSPTPPPPPPGAASAHRWRWRSRRCSLGSGAASFGNGAHLFVEKGFVAGGASTVDGHQLKSWYGKTSIALLSIITCVSR